MNLNDFLSCTIAQEAHNIARYILGDAPYYLDKNKFMNVALASLATSRVATRTPTISWHWHRAGICRDVTARHFRTSQIATSITSVTQHHTATFSFSILHSCRQGISDRNVRLQIALEEVCHEAATIKGNSRWCLDRFGEEAGPHRR